MMKEIKAFYCEEDGIGVVEMILILVVLVLLIVLFREKIKQIVDSAFNSIAKGQKNISKDF